MPVSMYKDYRYSYEPSYASSSRSVTLITAFQMVVDGEVSATAIFRQSPVKVQKIINDISQEIFFQNFENLQVNDQKEIFSMLLIALENTK